MSTDAAYAHAEHDRRIANTVLIGNIAAIEGNTASVQIDQTWTTDFLRVLQTMSGQRFRSWVAPTVGEQVVILSPSGEPGAGVILRGLSSDQIADPSTLANLLILSQSNDGALDQYDDEAHVRTITIPAGGHLVVNVGAQTSATVTDGSVVLKAGDSTVTIANGKATIQTDAIALDGAVTLGGGGGQAVARVGDTVNLQTGVIQTGSTKVTSA